MNRLRAALWPLVWSALAATVAMALSFALRAAFQVRTLPERMMEWLLLYVPIDAFASGIQSLGPQAKVLALYGSAAVMTAALVGLGVLSLWRRWSPPAVLGMAAALFLVAMGGLIPLTGGGFFGAALPQHPLLVNAVYACITLGYGTVLLLGRALGIGALRIRPIAPAGTSETAMTTGTAATAGAIVAVDGRSTTPSLTLSSPYGSRRAVAFGAAGTGVAYLAALRQASIAGGAAGSDLPLAQLPSEAGAVNAAAAAPVATVHPGLRDVPTVLTPELIATATSAPPQAAPAEPEPAPTEPSPSVPDAPLAPTAAPIVAPTQASAPQPAPDAPTSAPASAQAPAPTIPAAAPTSVPTSPPAPAAPAPTQDNSPLPAPPPARQLTRDQDGALTASIRQKGELATLVTPAAAHYVVTKNAVADPVLDAESWRLVLDGEVNRPVQLDYRTLRRLPAVDVHKTLECISNFTAMCELTYFGCDLISTAQWKGARLRDVLDLAGGLKTGTISLQVTGADEYSSSIPPSLATNPDTLLVYEMNGQALPRQHGYPVRLLSPGRYGYKSAKWVTGIRALRTEHVDWYGQRNWSRTGVVKTMSRIDVPANGARVTPGRRQIAGIAYAGDRGVGAVQFSSNGGRSWNPTVFLEAPLGKDTWVRWTAEFDLAPGQTLSLVCRAIDGTGQAQTDTFSLPQPNGGSGHHTIEVAATA